jgi:hypothetical protein
VVLKRRKVKEICKILCTVGVIFLRNENYAVFVAVIFAQNVKYFIFIGGGGSYLCNITCIEDAMRE